MTENFVSFDEFEKIIQRMESRAHTTFISPHEEMEFRKAAMQIDFSAIENKGVRQWLRR